MNLLNSATKIVLMMMTIWFIWLVSFKIIDWKDYVNAFLMVLSFYFGWKMSSNSTETIEKQ